MSKSVIPSGGNEKDRRSGAGLASLAKSGAAPSESDLLLTKSCFSPSPLYEYDDGTDGAEECRLNGEGKEGRKERV